MTNLRRHKLLWLLLPLVIIYTQFFYFRGASVEIKQALLQEKHAEITHCVDMLGAAVDANIYRDWEAHQRNIVDSVEYLDNLYQVYAGAYKETPDGLVLITDRQFETSIFEPFDYPEFVAAVTEERGSLVIGYTPEQQEYRELHLYFRWMPSYSDPSERYLVVAGVSEHSVTAQVSEWASVEQIASILISLVLNVVLVVLVVRHDE